MIDTVALWRSAPWRAEASAWIGESLDAAGIRRTGPVAQHRVRFWSTLLTVPTDRGTYWFKENHPAQAFEAALLGTLGEIAPDRVLPVLAVDRARGWFLAPDQGRTLREHASAHAADAATSGTWENFATQYAGLQRVVSARAGAVLASGLPTLDPATAVAQQAAWLEELGATPAGHPCHLDRAGRRRVLDSAPRLAECAARLSDLSVPLSLDHNDLHDGNAFVADPAALGRAAGEVPHLRFFDFGDAQWGHPFASMFIVLRTICGDDEGRTPRTDPVARHALAAYLDAWTDLAPRRDLQDAFEAAWTVAQLGRFASWWRLMRTPPSDTGPDLPVAEIAAWMHDCLALSTPWA